MWRAAAEELLEDGCALVQLRLLLHHLDAHTTPDGGLAAVGHFQAGDNAQEGRLPAAVEADQADAFAGIDGEGDSVQQEPFGELLGDVFEGDEVHADCWIACIVAESSRALMSPGSMPR